ncbi:MAG: acetyl-CoA decarbonylase/synthase complex subunit delta [Elusimicrobia bacterium RIFOXYB2_FULL_48_7]|nr:MAG: acetyl-CoA decarbonylase/synthase complex subunit delta [Elusimicrobia bacterium RIFOXYB2_FULL_48_7]
MEKLLEKSVSKISELVIGAAASSGGTRSKEIKIGGETALPFLYSEGEMPNKPVIAVEVWDVIPEDWPVIAEEFKDIVSDVMKWSKKAEEWGADLICLRLESCHPDNKNNSSAYAAETVKKILKTTKLPLIVIGCGHPEKDQEILPQVAEAAKGEKILIGMATKDNYKTITAAALAAGHSVIAESPLDINLAKQLNILVSDMGLPFERIVMHHTTGGLGYGFEYCYSIMERCRLAGLAGDKIMGTPIINMIAEETWKTKEAKTPADEQPAWGDLHKRAIGWEIACASGYLQAGANILVMEHPEAIKTVKDTINKLSK